MIRSFNFSVLPRIRFGKGKSGELPGLIKGYGSNIVFVTGKESFQNSKEGAKVLSSLKDNGMTVNPVIVTGEPSPALVNKTAQFFRKKSIDCVVAIGGGSVIDAGKAISAMIPDEGVVEDYLEGIGNKVHSGKKIPFIAVPTTAGTGSEATKNAVLSRVGAEGFKASLRHDNFVPDIAIVDPVLTLTCPPDITAASGLDCFTQLVESYISTEASSFTDALAQEGLKAVKTSLLACYNDGTDLEARTGMSFAAMISGICLANAGLGIVHGFASPIGARFNIPHGVICGTLMGAANEVNIKRLRVTPGCDEALTRYARMGMLFTGKKADATKDDYADAFVAYINKLVETFKIPQLSRYGIANDHIYDILKKADCKNNPVRLSPEDIKEIFMKRYK